MITIEWGYVSLLRTDLRSGGSPVVGENARTPSEHCWGSLEQGTEPTFPHGAKSWRLSKGATCRPLKVIKQSREIITIYVCFGTLWATFETIGSRTVTLLNVFDGWGSPSTRGRDTLDPPYQGHAHLLVHLFLQTLRPAWFAWIVTLLKKTWKLRRTFMARGWTCSPPHQRSTPNIFKICLWRRSCYVQEKCCV